MSTAKVRLRREMLGGQGANEAVSLAQLGVSVGLALVVLAVEGEGNAFVWPDGEVFLPLTDTEVIDQTGAGDALVAGQTRWWRAGLRSGAIECTACRCALAPTSAARSWVEGYRPARERFML